MARICGVLELERGRLWRWRTRAGEGRLDDRPRPGGNPVHALLAWEIEAILALTEEWGPTDRSHRKLAHRGSYLDRVWVSPSTWTASWLPMGWLPGRERPAPRKAKPWPEWVQFRPNSRESLGFYRLTPADQHPAPSVRRPGFVNPLGPKREFR